MDIWSCHWACVLVWPDLREFVFRAANTEAKGQVGEVECMLGIMKKARLYEARGEPIDWDCIRRDAEASLPTCHPWMEAVMAYCKSFAGGLEAVFIEDLAHFDNAFKKTAQRQWGGQFLDSVRQLEVVGNAFPIPELKTAILQAAKIGDVVIDGFCQMIKHQHLVKVRKEENLELVRKSETLLAEGRRLSSHLPTDAMTRIFGMLKVRVVMHIIEETAKLGRAEETLCKDLHSITTA